MKNKKKLFRGQRDDEEVIKVFHKHWISFIRPVAIFFPFFIISVIILYYQGVLGTGLLLFGYVIFLASLSYLLYNFVIWWWDVYILTNRRVIDFDQKTLFHRVVSEADLENIQDTTYEIKGLWQTVFNYGTVNILTASAGQNIKFKDVASPEHVQHVIISAKDKSI